MSSASSSNRLRQSIALLLGSSVATFSKRASASSTSMYSASPFSKTRSSSRLHWRLCCLSAGVRRAVDVDPSPTIVLWLPLRLALDRRGLPPRTCRPSEHALTAHAKSQHQPCPSPLAPLVSQAPAAIPGHCFQRAGYTHDLR
eukprot:scaffold53_cov362-Prasinococcus_capsulatus_cf.AAC.19